MKLAGTQAPNREKCNFVLVDSERAIDESDLADFTYYWGSMEHEYTDYSIPLKIILAGKVKNFRFTRREAEASYIWTDGDWKVASTEAVEKPFAFNWHWHANADKGLQELAEKLASSNRVVRAKARKELHSLSESGLKQLEGMSDDQGLVHQIELEKERRER